MSKKRKKLKKRFVAIVESHKVKAFTRSGNEFEVDISDKACAAEFGDIKHGDKIILYGCRGSTIGYVFGVALVPRRNHVMALWYSLDNSNKALRYVTSNDS